MSIDWDEVVEGADTEEVTAEEVTEEGTDTEEVVAELVPFEVDEDMSKVIDMSGPLTEAEARELTDHIRSVADALYVLIARAHAGRAWEPMGYNSFADYVREEFDISKSRAYQLLDQAKVVAEISAAAPDGTQLNVTEASARDLKHVINELVPDIIDSTENSTPDEATEIIAELIEDYRHNRGDDEDDEDGNDYDDDEESEYPAGKSNGKDDDDDEDFSDIDLLLDTSSEDLRRRIELTYALHTSLSALQTMPDPAQIIEWTQENRRPQIAAFLPPALEWLTKFAEAWNAQPWAEEVEALTEEVIEEADAFAEDGETENLFGEFE